MKKFLLLTCLLVVPLTNIFAVERTVNVAATSNYVFRGQTQTDDKIAIQATYHASQFKETGWYAGLFTSNVAKGIEVDLYGGWRAPFGRNNEFIFDGGVVEYIYSDDSFARTTHEFYAGVGYETSYFRYFIGENNTSYLDLGTSLFVLNEFTLELHYGRTYGLTQNGNDLGATLQKNLRGYILSAAVTYEDLGPKTDLEFFISASKDFNL